MPSQNMNYFYNVEYYDGLDFNGTDFFVNGAKIADRTKYIENFSFPEYNVLPKAVEEMDDIYTFKLCTAYPGLLIGTGAMHEIAMEDALKNGFTFDYVTGLPYLPGSSLKGMLRSYFPLNNDDEDKREYILSTITSIRSDLADKSIDVEALMEWIFGKDKPGNINFIGAFPKIIDASDLLLGTEYITPHPSEFKNPKPISILKIKPGVNFQFVFSCKDYVINGDTVISAPKIVELFERIILDMGIGAKTNVGFGVMLRKGAGINTTINYSNVSNNKNNKNNGYYRSR